MQAQLIEQEGEHYRAKLGFEKLPPIYEFQRKLGPGKIIGASICLIKFPKGGTKVG